MMNFDIGEFSEQVQETVEYKAVFMEQNDMVQVGLLFRASHGRRRLQPRRDDQCEKPLILHQFYSIFVNFIKCCKSSCQLFSLLRCFTKFFHACYLIFPCFVKKISLHASMQHLKSSISRNSGDVLIFSWPQLQYWILNWSPHFAHMPVGCEGIIGCECDVTSCWWFDMGYRARGCLREAVGVRHDPRVTIGHGTALGDLSNSRTEWLNM